METQNTFTNPASVTCQNGWLGSLPNFNSEIHLRRIIFALLLFLLTAGQYVKADTNSFKSGPYLVSNGPDNEMPKEKGVKLFC